MVKLILFQNTEVKVSLLFDTDKIIGAFICPHCKQHTIESDLKMDGMMIVEGRIAYFIQHTKCKKVFQIGLKMEDFTTTTDDGVVIDMLTREMGDLLR